MEKYSQVPYYSPWTADLGQFKSRFAAENYFFLLYDVCVFVVEGNCSVTFLKSIFLDLILLITVMSLAFCQSEWDMKPQTWSPKSFQLLEVSPLLFGFKAQVESQRNNRSIAETEPLMGDFPCKSINFGQWFMYSLSLCMVQRPPQQSTFLICQFESSALFLALI